MSKKDEGISKGEIFGFLLCLVLIGIGVFCGFKFYEKYTAFSQIYGNIAGMELDEGLKETVILRAEKQTDPFQSSDYSKTHYPAKQYDAEKNQYLVYINGVPVSTMLNLLGRIEGEFAFRYFGDDGLYQGETTLSIRFRFFASETVLEMWKVQHIGSSTLWDRYVENNGLNIDVVRLDHVEKNIDEIEIPRVPFTDWILGNVG